MDFKAIFDGLDKVTDILNVGRLIFYTTAGFSVVLPVSMSLRILAQNTLAPRYWLQFVNDGGACARRVDVWLAALVCGFIIATLANILVAPKLKHPKPHIKEDGFAYNYARLFSGGVPDGNHSATKDYAAWIIAEYYRYYEIIVFIPYGILLSLPIYWLYSLIYLIQTHQGKGFVFGPALFPCALWTLAAVIGWVLWNKFWIRKVVQPTYETWVAARHNLVQGLKEFVNETKRPPKEKL